MLQVLHGTGHIGQVAARLNWPSIRVNLDGYISRLDLVGKDTIVIRENRQVPTFQEGVVPWSLQRPMALVFGEYDAGCADVMFVTNVCLNVTENSSCSIKIVGPENPDLSTRSSWIQASCFLASPAIP